MAGTRFYFAGGEDYRNYINEKVKPDLPAAQQEKFKEHKSAPFCWLEIPGEGEKNTLDCKGGGDRFREWALDTFPADNEANKEIRELAGRDPSLLSDFFFNKTPGTAQHAQPQ